MLVTALVTPFKGPGNGPDLDRLQALARFQLAEGAGQLLLAGTTGEGAALSEEERLLMIDAALEVATPEQLMVGLGSGPLDQVIQRGRDCLQRGVRDLLLVDCPYSGASSAALRTAWHGPAAAALPEGRLFPYAVPGRTGTELLPDDLALLAEEHPNVVGVKDATGRLARMTRVRELCGDSFRLLCGDDPQARSSLLDPSIRADGLCSVVANLVPGRVRQLVDAGLAGEAVAARMLHDRLEPLFALVSVTSQEPLRLRGETLRVPQRARNPVPIKTALASYGLPVEHVRPPLDEMGEGGRQEVARILGRFEERSSDALESLRSLVVAERERTQGAPVSGRELVGRAP